MNEDLAPFRAAEKEVAGEAARNVEIVRRFFEAVSAMEFDAVGSFFHEEGVYQDIFEDSHTITINYWYESLSSGIGDHDLVSQNNGRETEANIKIDPNVNWWIDPTPAGDSEFNMQQTFWRDIPGQQNDWFNFRRQPPVPVRWTRLPGTS